MDATEIALSVALSQLVAQKEDLRSVRNQAAFAATVNGLIATFFANMVGANSVELIFEDPVFLWFSFGFWVVLIGFVASLAFSMYALVGVRNVVFDISPRAILDYQNSLRDDVEIRARVSLDAEYFFDKNEPVIIEARSFLQRALVCSVVQFVGWLLLIGKAL